MSFVPRVAVISAYAALEKAAPGVARFSHRFRACGRAVLCSSVNDTLIGVVLLIPLGAVVTVLVRAQ